MQSNQELYFYAGVLVRSFFRSVSSVGNKISDHQRRLPSPFTNNSHVKQKIVRLVRLSRMHFYSLNSGYPLDNGSRKKDSRTHRVYIFGWINFMDLSLFAECRTRRKHVSRFHNPSLSSRSSPLSVGMDNLHSVKPAEFWMRLLC